MRHTPFSIRKALRSSTYINFKQIDGNVAYIFFACLVKIIINDMNTIFNRVHTVVNLENTIT